ncbi:hypothetical protein LGQ02_20690 [Bacillus shivajii]|uniref:hypothetical protein n=1 Tax=Bacillus shivajii TaxID=1983719 RepID=UPI001CFBF588|nr:hypothetical protein [Bacillus shivajii]UCZ53162.1 hypothetical protein LGQ02_20690 [Bacillus shivajii]
MGTLTKFGKINVLIGSSLIITGFTRLVIDLAKGEFTLTSITFIPVGLAILINLSLFKSMNFKTKTELDEENN